MFGLLQMQSMQSLRDVLFRRFKAIVMYLEFCCDEGLEMVSTEPSLLRAERDDSESCSSSSSSSSGRFVLFTQWIHFCSV